MSFWIQGNATRRVLLGCALLLALFSLVFILVVRDLRSLMFASRTTDPKPVTASSRLTSPTVEDQVRERCAHLIQLSKTLEVHLSDTRRMEWEDALPQFLDTGAVLFEGKRYPLPEAWKNELCQATEPALPYLKKLAEDPLPGPLDLDRLPAAESWDVIYPYVEVIWNFRLILARAVLDFRQGSGENLLLLDRALPWMSRSMLLQMDNAVSLMGAVFEYHMFHLLTPHLKKLYLEEAIADPGRYQAALLRRSEYLERWCPLAASVQAEWRYMDVIYNERIKKDHFWSMTLLEVWYGHPGRPLLAMRTAMKGAEAQGITAMLKAWQAEHDKQFGPLKDMRSPLHWLQFLRIHPLASMAMPNYMGIMKEMANTSVKHHLITLGGLARLWFRDHGRWPAGDDPGFRILAGEAAVDPMNRGAMQLSPQADGTLRLYSVGINGLDEAGGGDDIAVTAYQP